MIISGVLHFVLVSLVLLASLAAGFHFGDSNSPRTLPLRPSYLILCFHDSVSAEWRCK